MRHAILRLVATAALLSALLSSAAAAPAASCASKFVGTWTVRVLATGQTYPAVISPSGTTHVTCPMCTPTGTWTCSGSTITVLVNAMAVSHTLAPDGRTMTGGCCTLTRVGRAPAVAAATPTKPQAAQQEPKQPRPGARQQANCSDITGTKSAGTLNVNCKPGGQKIAAAAPAAPAKPAQKNAAPASPTSLAPQGDAPTTAQQTALIGTIVDELGRARLGQVPQQPQTGASTPPPPDPRFNPREADPYRPPETLPVDGQPCVAYFRNMRENFKRRAALCLRDTRLLRSLTDMVENDRNTTGTEYITRNTAPELFAYFDPLDPRWTVSADSATPNCDLPMTVASQREAFMECARVYMCGMRAATCGLERAQQTRTNQCVPISRQCLAENPVPQQMSADPTPPPYREPPPSPTLPNPPRRDSTITGPSGPGGGGSSGGVMSAQ